MKSKPKKDTDIMGELVDAMNENPKSKKKIEKITDELTIDFLERDKKNNNSVKSITKHIDNCKINDIYVPKVVAEAYTKAKGCDYHNSLDWFCGEALYQYYTKYKIIERIKEIHARLKKAGHINKHPSFDNAFVFNDMDDKAMAYEYGEVKAIYHHMQTPVYLIILIENKYETEVHLRRLWDHPKNWYDDDYTLLKLLKKIKRIKAVKSLVNLISRDFVSEHYGMGAEMSDTFSKYPTRLCIEDYIKTKFGTSGECHGLLYGDCRDVGYMISFEETQWLEGKTKHHVDKVYSLHDGTLLIDLVGFLDGGLEELEDSEEKEKTS